MQKVIAIILAGGSGKRFGMLKQFIPIHNIPVCIYTLKKFSNLHKIFVVPKKYYKMAKTIIEHNKIKNIDIIYGGKYRQESVKNALEFIKKKNKCQYVIVTDANRPRIKKSTIRKGINSLKNNDGAVAVCKSINTTCESLDGQYLNTILSREKLYDLLMPQYFRFDLLYSAHKKTQKINATDDSQVILSVYPDTKIKLIPISFWEGLKLTNTSDYEIFDSLLKGDLL